MFTLDSARLEGAGGMFRTDILEGRHALVVTFDSWADEIQLRVTTLGLLTAPGDRHAPVIVLRPAACGPAITFPRRRSA